MGIIYIEPKGMSKPVGPYSYGVVSESGRTLYVSGMTARNESGDIVGVNDIKRQAEQCFGNIKRVTESCGGELKNAVKLTIYIKDWKGYEEITKAREKYWNAPYPASTTIAVTGFKTKELLMEVDAVIAM